MSFLFTVTRTKVLIMKEKNSTPTESVFKHAVKPIEKSTSINEVPEVDDTTREIISTHDDRNNDEGVDEQYGGDAADNRDAMPRK